MMGTESLMSGLTFAQIKLFKSQKALFLSEYPDSQFFYEVEFTGEQDMVEAAGFKKMFCMKTGEKMFLASVPQFLDHK